MRDRTRQWEGDYPKITAKLLGLVVKLFELGKDTSAPLDYLFRGRPWVHVEFSQQEEGAIDWRAEFADGGSIVAGRIRYVRRPCHYGGSRIYLVCPASGAACTVLYLYGGCWCSRQSAGLFYKSESVDKEGRLELARAKVRAKLRRGLGGDWREKPKGMHWDKFNALLERHDEIEDQLEDLRNLSFLRVAVANGWA